MNQRKAPLINGEFYHIFNRGVAKVPIFLEKRDYQRAVSSFFYYNHISPLMKFSRFKELSVGERGDRLRKIKTSDLLVEIVGYVLMPNHFHFLLRQVFKNGISIFLSKFTNSYTKYFNIKHERVGPLFQGTFRSAHIETQNQLLHVSRYIHLNPLTSYIVPDNDLVSYPWSSLPSYLSEPNSSVINSRAVLSSFSSPKKYLEFIMNQVDYQKKLKQIEHLAME